MGFSKELVLTSGTLRGSYQPPFFLGRRYDLGITTYDLAAASASLEYPPETVSRAITL